jgi:hypothetical protein
LIVSGVFCAYHQDGSGKFSWYVLPASPNLAIQGRI